MTIAGAIFRGEQLLITGELVYVFADPATQTSRPIPPALRALLEGFEAGEPALELRTGPWDTLGADATQVRGAVFIDEQGIAREDEWDEADRTALHAVANFGAQALVVPMGLDTFVGDPISGFTLHSADYTAVGQALASLGLPTVFTFEGGYAVAEVGVNAVNLLQGFERA